jgi:hypothetical protein
MRRRPSMQFLRSGKIGPSRCLRRTWALAAVAVATLVVPLPAAGVDGVTVSHPTDGIVGTHGWYRGSAGGNYIVVHWIIADPNHVVVSTTGCEYAVPIYGPTTGRTLTCTYRTQAGESVDTSFTWKVDADPPTGVAASLSRGPDFNGWYNHPLGITWHGTDATSHIASCSLVNYGGPDRVSARITGGCTDQAGNTALAPISINYDATAPVLSKVSVTSKAGSDLLRWTSSSPSDTVVIQKWARGAKQPAANKGVVFRGTGSKLVDTKIRSNIEYRYAVQTFDQAGNASRQVSVAALPKVLTLGKMRYTPRAAPEPILRWGRARRATYYHLQLFRGSKRILATWPPTRQLELQNTWKWAGHRYRLSPGRYRWYVWAGLGKRSFARYRTIGSAQFIVPR